MEVDVTINIKVELYFGGRMYFVRGEEIARGGRNISSWGEEIFPPPGYSVMGETLFCDTGNSGICRECQCFHDVYVYHVVSSDPVV